MLHIFRHNIYHTWLTAKAVTFLRLWEFWLVEEQQEREPGGNNSSLSARKVMANIYHIKNIEYNVYIVCFLSTGILGQLNN
jgi:hypothetical protein